MKKPGFNDIITLIFTMIDICFLLMLTGADPPIFTDFTNHIKKNGVLYIFYGLCVLLPNIIMLIQNRSVLEPYLYMFKENKSTLDSKTITHNVESFDFIDNLSGENFERYCAGLLRHNGFKNISLTPTSGDQGVDIIAEKDGIKYAIQCKCYSSPVGNGPVQEVHAGKEIYDCHVGVVMTNQYFTPGAKQAAEKTRTLLWDRDTLRKMIQEATIKTDKELNKS